MIQYSFLLEFNVEALKKAGTNAANWAIKNPGKAGMAAGAVVGGTTNKMKGGSFTGGAVKGAVIGGGVGLGAKAMANTKMGKSAIEQGKAIFAKKPAAETVTQQAAKTAEKTRQAANQARNMQAAAKNRSRKAFANSRMNPLNK